MNSFFELLSIYKWSIAASVLMAGALSLVGAQWTAREKSGQIFVLGQGASLGIVLGLVLNILLGTDIHGLNLVLGLSLGWLTLLLSDFVISQRSDRTHVYLTLFVFFLSLTYLISSMTPSLESHIASSYFGDLAVMSDFGAKASLAVAIAVIAFTARYWGLLSRISFQFVNHSAIHKDKRNTLFDVSTLIVTTLAIQSMGYLFSMGSLFIATTFASQRSRNLQSFLRHLLIISFVGTGLGFTVSLLSTTFPTVPCVLLGQMLVGLGFYIKK